MHQCGTKGRLDLTIVKIGVKSHYAILQNCKFPAQLCLAHPLAIRTTTSQSLQLHDSLETMQQNDIKFSLQIVINKVGLSGRFEFSE